MKLVSLKASTLAALALSAMACISLPEVAPNGIPVPNFQYIHSKPAVGDFAVHRTTVKSGGQALTITSRIEVTHVDAKTVKTKLEVLDSPYPALKTTSYTTMDRSGKVLQVESVTAKGSRYNSPIAGPGQAGYWQPGEILKLRKPRKVEVPAGKVFIRALRTFQFTMQSNTANGTSKGVAFLNDEIPFSLVRNAGSTEISLDKLLNRVTQSARTGGLIMSPLVRFIVGASAETAGTYETVLVKFGGK